MKYIRFHVPEITLSKIAKKVNGIGREEDEARRGRETERGRERKHKKVTICYP